MFASRFAFLATAVAVAGLLHATPASAQPTAGPDFFWLPPTVATAPIPTGPFDPDALDDLVVEVCELDHDGDCERGRPVERMTQFGTPAAMRIRRDANQQFYTVDWLTNYSDVELDELYRVRVLHADVEVGTMDVDFVQRKQQLGSVDTTRFMPAIRGQSITLRFRIQQPTPRTRVKINEVESNQGIPGDWIELLNTAAVPLDLSGHIIKDNDDTHVYTFPDGTTIQAHGHYVVEEAALDFGLGANEMARFYAPDGTTLIDAAAWTVHAPTTYGRCPDGSGAFQVNNTVTKGASNDCSIRIRINEIESEGGTPGDWIELYNPGPAPANLDGYFIWVLSDLLPARLPNVVVPAGGYLVLDQTRFRYSLNRFDAVFILRPDFSIADQYHWTSHAMTTYGRCPNGSGPFITTLGATRGGPNFCFVPITTLHINEVESSGGVPGDWFELVNVGATAVDISGWSMLDNDDTHAPYVFPAGSTVAPGAFLAVNEADFGFGLGDNDSVRLFDQGGVLHQTFPWGPHAPTTYGRCPDGTGPIRVTTTVTKAAANDCSVDVRINEVESDGGTPGDWIELLNAGPAPADIGGFIVRDNDNTHAYLIPAGTTIAPGGYLVVEEAAMGFSLDAVDSARLFDAANALEDSFSWTAHGNPTYGRCPNGSSNFATTFAASKGAANVCTAPVNSIQLNEIESSGGSGVADFFELANTGSADADLSGWSMGDNSASRFVFPAGTVVPAGGYLVFEEGPGSFTFGLGAMDSVRIFDAGGTLYQEYSWTAHAATTYGRCPDMTGNFATTATPTKGAKNLCAGDPFPWPGDQNVQTADPAGVLGGNMSGLFYDGPTVLWAAKNGVGSLYRLILNGDIWTPDPGDDWGNDGKPVLYKDGTGEPDAEGVTVVNEGATRAFYVSAERNNAANGISRLSVLKFNVNQAGATLTATREWNLTAALPPVGPNLGLEGITWIPDTFLVANNFFDEHSNSPYNPASYAGHGTGLFFVGVEGTGSIHAFALNDDESFVLIATFSSGFPGVMDLTFDADTGNLWAVCDNTCGGQSAVLKIDATTQRFTVVRKFERPSTMPNLNNEGFALAPVSECVGGQRAVFWADDSNTGGHAIRRGSMNCAGVP